MKWNDNNQYDIHSAIPQCIYNPNPSWSTNPNISSISVNDECIPLFHDEETVKCGCQEFGTYSTSTTHSYSVYLELNQPNHIRFDILSISITFILIFIFCIFIEPNCRRCLLGTFNDDPLISLEVYLPRYVISLFLFGSIKSNNMFLLFFRSKQKYRMWLLTREGALHFGLRHKFEKAIKYKNCKKLWYIWKHYNKNDGLWLPYCFRSRGSNHYDIQRVINLTWLIYGILTITMFITAGNTDINPYFCEYSNDEFLGTATFCTRKYEIPVTMILVIVLCILHFAHREIFQLIHPNKLQNDLTALLRVIFSFFIHFFTMNMVIILKNIYPINLSI